MSHYSLKFRIRVLRIGQVENPDNWLTQNIPGFMITITKSSDAHSGSSAARGDVASMQGANISPILTSGVSGQGFPFTNRPKSVSCWYKCTGNNGDVFAVAAWLKKGNDLIGFAGNFFNSTGSYTKATVDFNYSTNDIPDNCIIQVMLLDKSHESGVNPGSFYIVDDFTLEGTSTDVTTDNAVPTSFNLKQNYPNPFNPSTDIEYSVPFKSRVNISVYNLIGQKVADILNEEREAGTYKAHFNAGSLTSGVYFYIT